MLQPELEKGAVPISVAPSSSKKIERLEKKLLHYTGKAIADFKLIEEGDRLLVCVSGGKDSLTMLLLLEALRKKTRGKFELLAFTLDQSQPGWFDEHLRAFYHEHNIPYEILTKDTYSVVIDKTEAGKSYCGLCSRLRRGNIYAYAKANGFNKVVLGHHRDDLIQTLMMSIFYNGQIRGMPPKLKTDDGELTVIRPLVYCQEKDIADYAKCQQLPIIPCNLCGTQEVLARKKVAKLIQDLSEDNPKIPSNMLRALQNIHPRHLMDKNLFDFENI